MLFGERSREDPMPAVEKIAIALTAGQASPVRRAVAEGRCASTGEAHRGAVRDWRERRDRSGFSVGELRRRAEEGEASGDSDLARTDDVKARARSRLPVQTP
jgi:Arc/MetJ-type ribon-helix-helix transcriptional regulator